MNTLFFSSRYRHLLGTLSVTMATSLSLIALLVGCAWAEEASLAELRLPPEASPPLDALAYRPPHQPIEQPHVFHYPHFPHRPSHEHPAPCQPSGTSQGLCKDPLEKISLLWIPQGSVQLQTRTGMGTGGRDQSRIYLPSTTVRYGVTDRLEAVVTVDSFELSLKPQAESGLHNVFVGGKYMLNKTPGKFNIGVGAGVHLAAGSTNIGDAKDTPQLMTQMNYQLPHNVWGMTLIPLLYNDYKHERHLTLRPLSLLGYRVNPTNSLGVMYQGNFYDDLKPKTRVGPLWVHHLGNRQLLILTATHGLDQGAHRYQLEAQYMVRLESPVSRFHSPSSSAR